jgi:L-ribulose-5-phosphate 3-epimerase
VSKGALLLYISVVTDEISQDFAHALDVCRDLGISNVEIRAIDNINVVFHDEASLQRIKAELDRGGFRVVAIASPFIKSPVWNKVPGTDGVDQRETHEWETLQRSFTVAKFLGAPFVRTFSFLRATDTLAVRDIVLETLREAVRRTEAAGLKMVIENEHACNVATGAEAGWILQHLPSDVFGVTWDPGNEVRAGSLHAFPDGYKHIRDRVFHVHVKDADAQGTWVKMGTGIIDYVGQLHALAEDGYTGAICIETHYNDPVGGREKATRDTYAALREIAQKAGVSLA